MDNYGISYQGSKSKIADAIIELLPSGKRLVDLFGGGGAITHCALLSRKWKKVLYNDINPMITQLFMDAINGKYHNETGIVDKEQFNMFKNTDAYVKYCWSFGNDGETYLWGKDIETLKILACKIIVADTIRDRRLRYKDFILYLKQHLDLLNIDGIERLQNIERLERLQSLECLKAYNLESSNISYEDYVYQEGDVVYCDIPYEKDSKGKCNDYGGIFDNKKFYEWVKTRPYQIYFSSYEISDDSFYKIKIDDIYSLKGYTKENRTKVNEYIYSNKPINYINKNDRKISLFDL